MKYIALLRGINIGGNNKVEMSRLKKLFQDLGFLEVSTYINSGNVIFSSSHMSGKNLEEEIEKEIQREFKLAIRVMIRSSDNIKETLENIPVSWETRIDMRPHIAFLWPEIDSPDILQQIGLDGRSDNIKYIPGALLWNVELKNWSKDTVYKFTNGNMSKNISVRNINTLRKLIELSQ